MVHYSSCWFRNKIRVIAARFILLLASLLIRHLRRMIVLLLLLWWGCIRNISSSNKRANIINTNSITIVVIVGFRSRHWMRRQWWLRDWITPRMAHTHMLRSTVVMLIRFRFRRLLWLLLLLHTLHCCLLLLVLLLLLLLLHWLIHERRNWRCFHRYLWFTGRRGSHRVCGRSVARMASGRLSWCLLLVLGLLREWTIVAVLLLLLHLMVIPAVVIRVTGWCSSLRLNSRICLFDKFPIVFHVW